MQSAHHPIGMNILRSVQPHSHSPYLHLVVNDGYLYNSDDVQSALPGFNWLAYLNTQHKTSLTDRHYHETGTKTKEIHHKVWLYSMHFAWVKEWNEGRCDWVRRMNQLSHSNYGQVKKLFTKNDPSSDLIYKRKSCFCPKFTNWRPSDDRCNNNERCLSNPLSACLHLPFREIMASPESSSKSGKTDNGCVVQPPHLQHDKPQVTP